jgi:hypothetical protein
MAPARIGDEHQAHAAGRHRGAAGTLQRAELVTTDRRKPVRIPEVFRTASL